MGNFDILSLLSFDPPGALCKNCQHIFSSRTIIDFDSDDSPLEETWLSCPICNQAYYSIEDFIKIQFNDIMKHTRDLANIGKAMENSLKGKERKIPPMRIMLTALLNAKFFVHLTTYGISHLLLGALKVTSQQVDIKGIVSNVRREDLIREMTGYPNEHPRLKLIPLQASNDYKQATNIPHHKLIIIDGLLAFTGSTNFTNAAWRKVKKGYEYVQVITDIGAVQELNSRLFSRTWLRFNPTSRDYSDRDEIPF